MLIVYPARKVQQEKKAKLKKELDTHRGAYQSRVANRLGAATSDSGEAQR